MSRAKRIFMSAVFTVGASHALAQDEDHLNTLYQIMLRNYANAVVHAENCGIQRTSVYQVDVSFALLEYPSIDLAKARATMEEYVLRERDLTGTTCFEGHADRRRTALYDSISAFKAEARKFSR